MIGITNLKNRSPDGFRNTTVYWGKRGMVKPVTQRFLLFWGTSWSFWSAIFLGPQYSASQKKRNREVSMFYHNLITTIINEWYIFGKLRVSSFMWCYSDNAYFTHEWLKAIWRKETKKTFGGRYLNFEEKFTFLESWVSDPFIWHLNQEKWARNDKVLFV